MQRDHNFTAVGFAGTGYRVSNLPAIPLADRSGEEMYKKHVALYQELARRGLW